MRRPSAAWARSVDFLLSYKIPTEETLRNSRRSPNNLSSEPKEPAIGQVGTNFRVSAPRLYAHVNRERAKALGVSISNAFDTLQAYFGTFYINDFLKFGRIYHVQTEADAEYRSKPQDISKIYIRAQNGQGISLIPLDTVVTTEYQSGPDPVNHFNGYNTALVLGSAARGIVPDRRLKPWSARPMKCCSRKAMTLIGAIFPFKSVGWEANQMLSS